VLSSIGTLLTLLSFSTSRILASSVTFFTIQQQRWSKKLWYSHFTFFYNVRKCCHYFHLSEIMMAVFYIPRYGAVQQPVVGIISRDWLWLLMQINFRLHRVDFIIEIKFRFLKISRRDRAEYWEIRCFLSPRCRAH